MSSALAELRTAPPGRNVVLYDGHCKFCTAQASRLAALARAYYVPGIRQLADGIYAFIAARRYRIMGRAVAAGECTDACALHLKPRDPTK